MKNEIMKKHGSLILGVFCAFSQGCGEDHNRPDKTLTVESGHYVIVNKEGGWSCSIENQSDVVFIEIVGFGGSGAVFRSYKAYKDNGNKTWCLFRDASGKVVAIDDNGEISVKHEKGTHEKVSDKLSANPIDSRSAPRQPPESPPPAKPGSAP